MRDYYEVLQVSPRAEPEVIKAAYSKLALKYHPDRSTHPDALPRMKELNEAYEVLGNVASRREYDRSRGNGSGPGPGYGFSNRATEDSLRQQVVFYQKRLQDAERRARDAERRANEAHRMMREAETIQREARLRDFHGFTINTKSFSQEPTIAQKNYAEALLRQMGASAIHYRELYRSCKDRATMSTLIDRMKEELE